VGLRDRALIPIDRIDDLYLCAHGAVVAMRVEDYYPQGKRWWVRLHETGGKRREMPAHHNLKSYFDAYTKAAEIAEAGKYPLFRSSPLPLCRRRHRPVLRVRGPLGPAERVRMAPFDRA
jgi:hypothetical protein